MPPHWRTSAIEKLANVFYLSQGERHLLLTAEVGESLFFAGQNHVAMRVVASPEEHALITTDPREALRKKEEAEAQQYKQAQAALSQKLNTAPVQPEQAAPSITTEPIGKPSEATQAT